MSSDIKVLASGGCLLARPDAPLTGVRRLGQRFLVTLLTRRGSMKYLPDVGCDFMTRLRRGVATEYGVVVAFSSVRNQLKRGLRADETSFTPRDERYDAAQIGSIVLTSNGLQLYLTVRSKAGTTVRVVTPPIVV